MTAADAALINDAQPFAALVAGAFTGNVRRSRHRRALSLLGVWHQAIGSSPMRATAFTAALMALFTAMAVCGMSAGPTTRGADNRDRIQGTWGFGSVVDQGKEQRMPKENRVVIT